jgi:putative phage-type endonuclease
MSNNPFSPEEEAQLVETAYSLVVDFLNEASMIYIQPYFHEYVILEITELLKEQLSDIFKDVNYFENIIISCIEQAMKRFYTETAPKRSYITTFIRNNPINNRALHDILRDKITYLQNVPQPEQRTPEWYNFRSKYLTASSIWKAFISDSTRNQLIYDKCKPFNADKYNHTSTDSPMHWGQKYESVSAQLYKTVFNTKLGEFGCIPHKTMSYLAASPDGINILETSSRYGRMLEIKNIVNREIDGNPKMEYWIQMQLQMEVCNLNECDFLETRFKEYENEEEFLRDGTNTRTSAGKLKGSMIQFMIGGHPYYEYAPLDSNKEMLALWEEAMMDKHANHIWVKNIYWRLDELSCILVLRNKFWFNHAIPILNDLWNTIEYEKINGYQHRAPNKRVKIDPVNTIEVVKLGFCAFDDTYLEPDPEPEPEPAALAPEPDNITLTIETEIFTPQ